MTIPAEGPRRSKLFHESQEQEVQIKPEQV